jgi:hypothetical protein
LLVCDSFYDLLRRSCRFLALTMFDWKGRAVLWRWPWLIDWKGRAVLWRWPWLIDCKGRAVLWRWLWLIEKVVLCFGVDLLGTGCAVLWRWPLSHIKNCYIRLYKLFYFRNIGSSQQIQILRGDATSSRDWFWSSWGSALLLNSQIHKLFIF